MKIFNTMNKLFAAVAMTAAISMGTSAHADMVYDGLMEASTGDVFWGEYDATYSSFSSETTINETLFGPDGSLHVYGDNYGLSIDLFSNIYEYWQVDLSLIMTFDTATEITIETVGDFTGVADLSGTYYGTYTVDAGDSFAFNYSLYTEGGYGYLSTYVAFTEIPAPGALALLGVAGISTRRRRR